MSTENELKDLMGRVDEYGDAVASHASRVSGSGLASKLSAYDALENRLRALLTERDALKDALDSYIGFVGEAHIIEGQFHWLPSGSSQDIIDAARKGEA